ncbi:MAG: dephospho-CoA kinase [Pseudomonadota bacterium]
MSSSKKSFIIGLSGGIGSGKTTVSDTFSALGVDVVDADVISHQTTALGSPTLPLIQQHFGDEALLADGNLNRPWLRQHIFNTPADKLWLEQLLHPIIHSSIMDALNSSDSDYVLFVSPLLIKSQLTSMCQRIVMVDCSVDQQIKRTQARDNSSQETIESIIEYQSSRDERLAHADDVIDNSGGLIYLKEQISTLHTQYLALAKQFHDTHSLP